MRRLRSCGFSLYAGAPDLPSHISSHPRPSLSCTDRGENDASNDEITSGYYACPLARLARDWRAGFGSPRFEPLDRPMRLGQDMAEVLDNIGKFGPLARLFAEASPDNVAKAKDAIAEALKPHVTADGVMLASACWLVRAAPG